MNGAGRSSPKQMAAALADALRAAGTKTVFGVPGGGTNLDLVGAVEAVGIRFVLAHGETAAAIMAGAAAELSGRPGACLMTRGPGAACAVNGAAQSLLDRQPVLVVTDCVAADDLVRVSKQRLDQHSLFETASKVSLAFGPYNAEEFATAAVALSLAGRPGPVHLDFDSTAAAMPIPACVATWASPSGQFDLALRLIAAARRPIVIAGVAAVAACEAVRAFVDGTGIPVLTTYKARGVVGDSSPNAAGLMTGATAEAAVISQADLVIGVGLDPVELLPAAWRHAAPVVLLGAWPNDSAYFGERLVAEVVGDLRQMLSDAGPVVKSDWVGDEAQRERRAVMARLGDAVPAHPAGLSPQDVVTIARAVAPDSTIATVDAGAHMLVAMPLWEVERTGEVLISSGLATMGFALPAAIGAAVERPDARVVCFTGDGGLGMVLAELETLSRLRSHVVVVVFNDSLLSLIAIKQQPVDQGGERAVRYGPIDYAMVAAGCGIPAERAANAEQYAAALRVAFQRNGPTLIDVTVDPSAYPAVINVLRG